MPPVIDISIASRARDIPSPDQIRQWASAALPARSNAELSVRVVGRPEMQQLNASYRGKDYATNVLSFPAELPPGIELPLLGDIVICAAVVNREARQQHKPVAAHWAHMLVHGTLHLQGYDHENDADAHKMESREKRILARLGFADPYQDNTNA